jgi:general stress protein CsbA
LLLAVAILYSEFVPKSFKLTKKSVLIGLAILPVFYLIFQYFSKPFGVVNIFNDYRVEVSEGITTTANNLFVNNIITLPKFITGFFGSWGLGWFELELTQTVWLFTLQAFLLVVGFALMKSRNIHRLIFGALFATMCAAILYANQQKFGKIGEYIQPRYFLPFFLGIVIIAAANKTERYPNSLVITVAILATISNSIALRDTIRRYTTGQDVFISKSLNNPIEWWWQFGPQPETVWLTGTLAFAALWALLIYDRNKNEVEAPNSHAPELAN